MINDDMSIMLDFAHSDEYAGFRLHDIEVYNWGTFNQRVWRFSPKGDNALLTGDIGSGKSTLVDAITTLLVPAQKIAYNKAAGAEARERTLRSYVLGYFKSERSDSGLNAKPVALRDHNNYSVVLGHFYNEGYDQHVTLAQVFYITESRGQPERFYVVADQHLSITEHFSHFGSDINGLRKRLREMPDVTLNTSFNAYSGVFRRRFGINDDQALELFSQTVSMKSVGNLTDFVREHMLEEFPVEERIQALIQHFDDLSRAHEAVLKAKQQISLLQPIISQCNRYVELEQESQELLAQREALSVYFGGLKYGLLEKRLTSLDQDLLRLTEHCRSLEERNEQGQARRDELNRAIASNGGDRLATIKNEIAQRTTEKQRRQASAQQYDDLAERLELVKATDADAFLSNQQQLPELQEEAQEQHNKIQNDRNEIDFQWRGLRQQHQQLKDEIDSLCQRRSNIPARILDIRSRLCESLSIDDSQLPFVGELLQVQEDEKDWEGVSERLLHNFGLSLLVPDELYSNVAQWVEKTHLGGRLVYFRVREKKYQHTSNLHPDSLVRKLQIKPDTEFYNWLEEELLRRFDYACCTDMAQFRREEKAVSRNGQIKTGYERHEKDDRHRLDDRTRYILGWSNEEKIAALTKELSDLEMRLQQMAVQINELQKQQESYQQRFANLSRLEVFQRFQDLDWRPLLIEIEQLDNERRQLEAKSDTLRTLQDQLRTLEVELKQIQQNLDLKKDEYSRSSQKRDTAQQLADEAATLVNSASETQRAVFPSLERLRNEVLEEHQLSVESCATREKELREWLQTRLDNRNSNLRNIGERITKAMSEYCIAYPMDTQEVDASIDAANEYRSMLDSLEQDGLPQFEQRFKSMLNENIINEIANFQSHLRREEQDIRERIEEINRSLQEIDYNPGRLIQLEAQSSGDGEIANFRHDLKACTEGSLSGTQDEQYAESKFLQVRQIIERFRGRDGSTEIDKRWTRKVCDVRNWFVFSASERWREDNSEHEHYSDSGGKSGGQKEKLAYTVLAASLAYRFGLEWGVIRSRSFRFVVIDEAFGRGSDESARYGLELFRKLNLQLLIVTPLQKIHIIEPYVASVGFVHNEEGRESMLRCFSIEEFREQNAKTSVE